MNVMESILDHKCDGSAIPKSENYYKCMYFLGFTSSMMDPDAWRHEATNYDGSNNYYYVLLYTDKLLAVSDKPRSITFEEIEKRFTLKENSIGPPSQYLGGKMLKVEMENGQ